MGEIKRGGRGSERERGAKGRLHDGRRRGGKCGKDVEEKEIRGRGVRRGNGKEGLTTRITRTKRV